MCSMRALEIARHKATDPPAMEMYVADELAKKMILEHTPYSGPIRITGNPAYDSSVQVP